MACTPQRSRAIGDLAAGKLPEPAASELLQHLEKCSECSLEFDLVAELVARAHHLADRRPWLSRPSGRLLLAASILVAVALGFIVLRDTSPPEAGERMVASLATLDPLPAPPAVLRSGGAERPDDPGFETAMDLYRSRRYPEAALEFAAVLEDRPDHALALFYRGVSLLQYGQIDEAVASLERASRTAEGLLQERALWYMANAELARSRFEPARKILKELVDRAGDYELNAREKLDRIARAGQQ